MASIAILGAGGWGTALAIMTDQAGHTVTLWSAFSEEIEQLRRDHEHKKLLNGIPIRPSVRLTDDLNDIQSHDLYILAAPSYATREVAAGIKDFLPEDALIVNASKGLENETFKRLSEVISEELPGCRVVALSGPSHAEEVAQGMPTSLVAAGENRGAAEQVQDYLSNPNFRVYTSTDIIGVELGGCVKNVIALSAGICDGMGLGDNTKSALITRGLSEMARLGTAMGGVAATFSGLSGIGDLIVTCTSMHSRNRRAGILVGQGVAPAQAVERIGTVEGYHAARLVYQLGKKHGVELPITEQSYLVMYEGKNPEQAVSDLMGRPKKSEHEKEETA